MVKINYDNTAKLLGVPLKGNETFKELLKIEKDTMAQQNSAMAPEISGIQADDAAERQELAADSASEREVDKAKKMPSPSASTK